jgi:hypothetical protein
MPACPDESSHGTWAASSVLVLIIKGVLKVAMALERCPLVSHAWGGTVPVAHSRMLGWLSSVQM